MKKLVVILFLVLTQLMPLRAELVSPQTAARCAGSKLGVEDMPLPDNTDAYRAAGRGTQISYPGYYVCNYPGGGWVVIAADDRVSPVLAYSDSGSFDDTDLPDNLKWWMEGVSGYVDAVRGSDLKSSREVAAEWQRLLNGNNPQSSERKVIETAFWHQSSPFNDLCPIVTNENKRAAVGCVATALAIILRYYKWPEHGHGTIGGYASGMFEGLDMYIPAYSIDNHYYDWESMPLKYSQNKKTAWTKEQERKVAQLAYDCSVMVETVFSYDQSGAYLSNVVKSLSDHLGYKTAAILPRSNYSLDEWRSVIMEEIDQDRLVIYSGDGDDGGHAFVCDGYDVQGKMLHFNWGWGDVGANGFYTLDLTLPEKIGFTFPDDQQAIVGITPGTGQEFRHVIPPFSMVMRNGHYGFNPKSEYIAKGSQMSFRVGPMDQVDPNCPEIGLKVCLEDKDGNIKQDLGYSFMTIDDNSSYVVEDISLGVLNVDPELTDVFKLYIMTADSVWVPMSGNRDLLPDQKYVTCGVTRDPLILVERSRTPGLYELSLTTGYMPVKTVEWTVNGGICSEGKTAPEPGMAEIKAQVQYLDGTSGSIYRTFLVE